MVSMSREEIIQHLVATLAQEKEVRDIYLFGSSVGSFVRPDSDIDLLLTSSTALPMHRRAGPLYRKITSPLPVDLIVYTPEEFNRKKNVLNTLPYEVSRKGKIIYSHP